MWPTNGFEHNRNNFSENVYPPSPFGGPPGQQYFPPFQPNISHFQNTNGEGLVNGEFQPELGMYNKEAFAQNQLVNSPNAHFPVPSSSPLPAPSTSTPVRSKINIPNMNSRAAELKAQLLKKQRERASSATPPVVQAAIPQPIVANKSSSLRGSPQTLATTTEHSEQEININELISQFADPKPTPDTEMKHENNNSPIQPQPEPSAKSQKTSLGSPANVTEPHDSKVVSNGVNTRNAQSKHASSGSMSEGEILEDRAVTDALPGAENESRAIARSTEAIYEEKATPRNPRDEEPLLANTARRNMSPRRALPYHSRPQPRHLEDRHDEADPRQDRRIYPSKCANERQPYPSSSNRSPHQRRDVRNDDHHRSEIRNEKRDEPSQPNKQRKKPMLEELLPHDEDLKEWLEITGYHNESYRIKILSRRRAIAALDAQRNALLAEMEAEERGVQLANGVPAIMLPPPISNKIGDRAEPLPKLTQIPQETQHDRIVPSKRIYGEALDTREESSSKAARTNENGSGVKHEVDEYGRPRSSGYDASRRWSFDDKSDGRNSSRPPYEEFRGGHRRVSSRERDLSPATSIRKSFASRSPPQIRGYEVEEDSRTRDRDTWEDRERARSGSRERPQFGVRGRYQGRVYDPNYRGRGRGSRGRGRRDYQNHAEPRVNPRAFSARIADGKPYKDMRGFDRGSKGGQ